MTDEKIFLIPEKMLETLSELDEKRIKKECKFATKEEIETLKTLLQIERGQCKTVVGHGQYFNYLENLLKKLEKVSE